MPVLYNYEARLLVCPTIGTVDSKTGNRRPEKYAGQTGNPLRLLPGRNRIDKAYWGEIKGTAAIKAWCRKDPRTRKCMIEYMPSEEMPDPGNPPTAADLAAMTTVDLKQGLNDPDTPINWHKSIQKEIDKRAHLSEAEKPEPEPEPEPDHLVAYLDMNASDLIASVSEIDDTVLLMELNARDERVTVKRAIDERLEELALVDDEPGANNNE